MIKVLNIEVHEFRGIRKFSIDFKGENFAICGRNGTGKSGIVDALEFGLTGNVSRLSGRGTGDISLKDHGPHVDSRNRPDKARVKLTVKIANVETPVTIERSVENAQSPTITPSTPAVLEALRQVGLHPEFALTRRELIRYVLTTPGDRAKEVQALLRLDAVDGVRTTLQRIANGCQRAVGPLGRAKSQARDQLLTALQIPEWSTARVLAAVNEKRKQLGLAPLSALSATTSVRDGLATAAAASAQSRIAKVQATADLGELRGLLKGLVSAEISSARTNALKLLQPLASDPNALDAVQRERFLTMALNYVESDACPVCDTEWDPDELRALVGNKLKRFEEVTRQRAEIEKLCLPLVTLLEQLVTSLRILERYCDQLKPKIDAAAVVKFRGNVTRHCAIIASLDPLPDALKVIETFLTPAASALDTLTAVETAVTAIPSPTEQDAARDYLTVVQERLEAYRAAALAEKRAEEQAVVTQKVYETYGAVSTSVLNGIYKKVETQFGELYRYVNRDDEDKFAAQLTPSMGKLGFDVDFYGRGFFPPGAYHSEGHQDGMGVCLYLALMTHLLGNSFSFAVLDDVLMSVDAGHRREVCKLLKDRFPNTQFILTTHDEIWLRHMKSAGLIAPKAFVHFRTWDVEHGPTEWDDRDVWQEIDAEVARNDIRAAAGLLRHYLEFICAEICHDLRAPVEFRGDAQFQLGDLLPAAAAKLGTLFREGKASAQSWGKSDDFKAIEALEALLKVRYAATGADQWQVNAAIHYNAWAGLTKEDFEPVVVAYRELMQSFSCSNPKCLGLLYVQPERGTREGVRCACGDTNINLRKK
jgi:recombinational DNA repair ATPase RecF